uniref:Histone deacetylase complex subunit SAP130 C-terminal domain-containing protein n=1 Tax=Denticeps clupeoides TaxID=299321 RepID=A0AAY4EUB3_9TELE
MSSQQFPRTALSSGGVGQGQSPGVAGEDKGARDADHAQDHPPSSSAAGAAAFRDEKQETVVVRPYPQVQTLGPPPTLPQHVPIQPSPPVTVAGPPVHLTQGQTPNFSEGSVKGHSSNLHHLMATNVQIIRSSTPTLQISSPAAPTHTFTSHLPRGAAAAAVMSSSKGATVLRPASGGNAGPGPSQAMQHIIHQPIQSRPAVSTSTAVLPTVVAPISAARTQSPVISPSVTHSSEIVHGRPGLTIHQPSPATISIQRPPTPRDTATRITLPSHPAIGAQKAQPPHTMTQKPIFSTVTPVAAATVAPILATNTVPSTTATGSVPHTQMTSSTIVTMTMPSHSSHASAVTTSAIPVAKVVPQPIAHTSPRIQPDYPGERTNLIPISGHRSSPNPVAMEARSDNRPSVPVQFQYFLPTYSSSPYPLTHTYTPITSSVSTIRQYPVTPQAPSSALPTQTGVGVATTVHLNHMQLMAVDRIGLQSAQSIQPASMTAQGIQPAPIGVQGLHATAPISTQGIQQTPVGTQQPQPEAKAQGCVFPFLISNEFCHGVGMVLAEGPAFVTNPIGSTFSATQPVTTVVQTHPQGASTGGPTLVSSPRPSILRKKPANEGCWAGCCVCFVLVHVIKFSPHTKKCMYVSLSLALSLNRSACRLKPKTDVHVAMASPVMAAVEALPTHGAEQQPLPSPAQHLSQAIPALLASPVPAPPSQPTAVLSALPAAMAVTPPVPASMANAVASPTQPAASSTAACAISSTCPEVKVKQEVEAMDTSQPGTPPFFTSSALSVPSQPGDLLPGASPRKKPRKQQHKISTEETEMMETNSTDEEKAIGRTLGGRSEQHESPPREYVDEEGVRYVPVRPRPPITLLRHYRNPWKAAYHHFQRYNDIRVKEEKKCSLQDVANQRGVACRAQGWKIHLCAAQLLQLSSLEHDVYSRLTTLQEGLIPKKRAGGDDELHRINELIQGNMQRCKLVMDQVTEARDTMMKVLDHKDRVLKLLNKNGTTKKTSKLKRKERA